MNWVLFGSVALLIVLGLTGLKLGVVKMVYHLVGFVLALVLTAMLAPIVSKALIKDSSPAMEKAKEKVVKTLKLDEIDFDLTLSDDILDKLNLPEAIRDEIAIFNSKELYKKVDAENAKDYVATSIATIIIQAIVYIVCFIILYIAVFFAFRAINLVDKLPGLHTVNRFAGLVVGLLFGACIILVFFVFVTALANLPAGQYLLDCIEDNAVLKFWYDNNPLNGGFVSLSRRFK